MLVQLLVGLCKRYDGKEINQRTLQRLRTAAVPHRGTLAQGSSPSGPFALLRLLDLDVPKQAFPAEFVILVPYSHSPHALQSLAAGLHLSHCPFVKEVVAQGALFLDGPLLGVIGFA